uniref:small integral membrane protein 26 isoform X1 n=1 Tax=Nyctereutes procyonoides TaxID=34880 RepID=UPI002444F5EA|nr:small integral membrane protein 26 isoform X1 [Nyctereutes procyonoides]
MSETLDGDVCKEVLRRPRWSALRLASRRLEPLRQPGSLRPARYPAERKSADRERVPGRGPHLLEGDEVEQKDVSRNEMLEPPKGFYMETIVTYKEDFVPVTDRILNFLKSWTGGPGPES